MGEHNSTRGGLAALRRQVKQFYVQHIETRLTAQGEAPPDLEVAVMSSQEEYRQHTARMQDEYKRRKEVEDTLDPKTEYFETRGYCFVCAK